jgi:hypothetical protein
MQSIEKTMTAPKWKILAIPKAKQKMIHSRPFLKTE